MRALMTLDLAAIRKRGQKTPAVIMHTKIMLPEEELRTRVKSAMKRGRGDLTHFEEVSLDGKMRVYTGLVEQKGRLQRLFAQVVSRPAVCDVCHDVYFLYVFDADGKVIQLDPLQLTKWANEPWSEEDLKKIRERLVGRYIFNPFTFDPRVDAVTSATITTAVIFDSLSQGHDLFRALKKKGLIR